MRSPVQVGSALQTIYTIPVLNTHTTAVPPYGVMQIYDGEQPPGETLFRVKQFDGSARAKFLINGPVPIPAGKEGYATDFYPCIAACDGISPAVDSEIGPALNSWLMTADGRDFIPCSGTTVDAAGLLYVAYLRDRSGSAELPAIDCGLRYVNDGFGNPIAIALDLTQIADGVTTIADELNCKLHAVTDPGGGGQVYTAGCGLTLDGNQFSFAADPVAAQQQLSGLKKLGTCSLAVNVGCGLLVDSDINSADFEKLRVNALALAGKGLVKDPLATCSINVNPGLGITLDTRPNDDKHVGFWPDGYLQNANQLYGHIPSAIDGGGYGHFSLGCGLHFQPGFDVLELRVKAADLIDGFSTFVSTNDPCKISTRVVTQGCGIHVAAMTVNGIRLAQVSVMNLAATGGGLEQVGGAGTDSCHLKVKRGCGLKIDSNQALAVDFQALTGPGIARSIGSSGQCDTLRVNVGLGLTFDHIEGEETARVSLHNSNYVANVAQLYGHPPNPADGIEFNDSFAHINIGCGLKYLNGAIVFDNEKIAMQSEGTLQAIGACGLRALDGVTPEPPIPYTEGCGIDISASNVISVDPLGLRGCGLKLGNPGIDCSLAFDPVQVAGDGLEPLTGTGECGLQVNLGCGLQFENFAGGLTRPVGVKLEQNAGLECSQDGLAVKPGCGLELATDGCVKVKPLDLAGGGLTVEAGADDDCDGPCALKVNTGCGLEIVNDAVRIKREDLIGPAIVLPPTDQPPGIIEGPGNCNLGIGLNTSINSIEGCALELVNGQLRLTLTYRQYQVMAVRNPNTTIHTCTVATTPCPT